MKKRGFTLVELLVVITIIAILGGIVISVAGSMINKARISGTQGTIKSLLAACSSYKAVYYMYPNLDDPPNTSSSNYKRKYSDSDHYTGDNPIKVGTAYTEADFSEYNKRIRFMLEDEIYYVDEVEKGPFIDNNPPKRDGMYVDAWDQIIYVCPGRDHTGDTPGGPDNYGPDNDGTDNYNVGTLDHRFDYPPDIYSLADNGEDDTNGTYKSTAFDSSTGDDLVSWKR